MTEDREEQLDEIIADYLQSQEAGRTVSEQEVIAAHPELAEELREFFDDLGQMNELAAPVVSQQPVLEKIRYFGDYELLEEIARGGMGIVYKARQASLNRIVAVKLILSGHLASETDVKRFQTEAESAANLQHPHIVSVFEVGRHKGQSYFSMEYIDGKNLSEIVRDHPLPPKQAAEYVREVAEAIDYAHQQGTLHRDLKPSNVLVDQHDRVQITDFGLAMKVEGDSELTRTGQVLGTPSYMPPEQAQHKRGLIGPGSDIYSMGAILYELLTGRPPFQTDSAVETLRQVIETEPLSPRLLNPALPKDLETICLKCLQKEPHKRYATAQHLSDDLSRFLQGKPILARPVGRVERAWRWCKRKPVVAGLSMMLALSLVVGTIVSSTFAIESKRNAEFYHNQFQRAEGLLDEKGRLLGEKTQLADDLEVALAGQKQATAEAEQNADLARRQSYISDMNRVQVDFEENRMGRVRELLNRHIPAPSTDDLRGFERFYWEQRCPLIAVLKGHTGSVMSVAFSPDGTRIASAGSDYTVKLWDVATGQEVLTLKGHRDRVYRVAFSPDGPRRIASASRDHTVKLWDAVTGAEVLTLKGHTYPVFTVAFSPDGGQVISAGADATIRVWSQFEKHVPSTIDVPRRIAGYRKIVEQQSDSLKPAYELASMLRYTGDIDGYHEVCQHMLEEFSKPNVELSAHDLLMAYVFVPEGKVTSIILEIAKQHAEGNNLVNDRMLALAYHRLGQDEQALPLLEAAAKQANAASDSRITTWLNLALVQIRLKRFEEARKTVLDARLEYLRSGADSSDSPHRKPWGAITSLWREVEQAMKSSGLDEPIPALPPLYHPPAREESKLNPLRAPRPD